MASRQPETFNLHVPDAALADLRERLSRTRFPDQAPGDPWAYGTDLDWLVGFLDYWRDGFDWRAQEARLNSFPQYRVSLQNIELHFMHVPGNGPDPHPLLLSHGWPGSVFEFLDLIPRLTDPKQFGADPADAFTVVVPSLPGYGLSFTPGQARFGIEAIADCFAQLMTDVLGYKCFGAQGGDWGSTITARLGRAYPERMSGLHLNMMPAGRDPEGLSPRTPEESRYLEELRAWLKEESGLRLDSRDSASDARLCSYGLSCRSRGLDFGEIPCLVRLQWRPRNGFHPGSASGEYRAVLVYRRDRFVLLALLLSQAYPVANRGDENCDRADRLL